MDEIWLPEMLSAGEYPENEEIMQQYSMEQSQSHKTSYELISKLLSHIDSQSVSMISYIHRA